MPANSTHVNPELTGHVGVILTTPERSAAFTVIVRREALQDSWPKPQCRRQTNFSQPAT